MEKVRVINFVPGLGSGGIGILMMEWFKRKDDRVSIDIATIGDGLAYNILISQGCNIFPIYPLRQVGIIKYTKTAYQIIKNGKYDVVHSHVGLLSFLVFFAAIIAKVNRRILHAHGTKYNTDNGSVISTIATGIMKKLCVWTSTDYIACSKNAALYLFGERISSKKAKIIHNGIDLSRFNYQARTEHSEKVIGYVARFEKNKNHIFLLKVLKKLLNIRKNITLLLIGGGDPTEIIKESEKMGLREHIKILEPQQNIEHFYHEMDVFVFPSKNEGLGIVAIEAQACGIPTVASPGVPEEAIISSIGTRVDLDVDLWVKKIDSFLDLEVGEDIFSQICNSDYNVTISSKRMMEVYLGEA